MRGNQANRRLALLLGGAIGAFVLGAGAANANITYNVNQTIGAGGVTGTITTDGATGTLTGADFVAWSLLLTDGVSSFTLNQGNSDVLDYASNSSLYGAPSVDVTATSTDLKFDFNGPDPGYLGFQAGGDYSGQHYWCLATASQAFACKGGGQTVAPISVFVSYQFQGYSGNQIFASVAAGGVPEPSTWAMMMIGVAGLGAAMRMGRRRSALAAV